jgi:Ion channel
MTDVRSERSELGPPVDDPRPDEQEPLDLLAELAERRDVGWRERLTGSDRYGVLFLLIVTTVVGTVLLRETRWERLVAVGMVGLMLVFALRTSMVSRRVQRAAMAVVPLLVIGTAVAAASVDHVDGWRAVVSGTIALLLLAVLLAIVGRLTTHLTISWNTIMGALCVYLLLGMTFAAAYAVVGHLEDGPLFEQQPSFNSADTIYYSLITLATVGFGDLTMRSDLPRIMSAIEAVLGQLYLITAVGLLVGNLGRRRRARPPARSER